MKKSQQPPDKLKPQKIGSENFAGWLCDTYDAVRYFFAAPYFSERLFAPVNKGINALDNHQDAAKLRRAERKKVADTRSTERKKAAVTRRKEHYAALKANPKRTRRMRAMRFAVIPLVALIVSGNILALAIAAYRGQNGLVDESAVSSADAATSIETQTSVTLPNGGVSVESNAGAQENIQDSEDTQYIQYALSNEGRPPQASALSSTATQTPGMEPEEIPHVYILDKDGKRRELSSVKHSTRFDEDDIILTIDVSSNQGKIDWKKVAACGVEAAMIRVGYRGRNSGKVYEDDWYEYNLREANKAGIMVGAYFYSQAITVEEGLEEAEFIIKRISGFRLTLPVAIDYEYESMSVYGELNGRLYDAKLTREAATDVVVAFCDEVKSYTYVPMVYANKNMFTNSLNIDRLSNNYKIWLACFAEKADYTGLYHFWQHTDGGVVYGIDDQICLDFWYKED